jgi:hypothetical protein
VIRPLRHPSSVSSRILPLILRLLDDKLKLTWVGISCWTLLYVTRRLEFQFLDAPACPTLSTSSETSLPTYISVLFSDSYLFGLRLAVFTPTIWGFRLASKNSINTKTIYTTAMHILSWFLYLSETAAPSPTLHIEPSMIILATIC